MVTIHNAAPGRVLRGVCAIWACVGLLAGCGGGDAGNSRSAPAAPLSANAADPASNGCDDCAPAQDMAERQADAAAALALATQPGRLVPVIGVNITAATYKFNAGNPPPDSMGAVGPNHFVEFINSRFAVYDKSTGHLVKQSTIDDFWEASWANTGAKLSNPFSVGFPQSAAFDPRIVYDTASARWYATADGSLEMLVAVSNTSDPTQGWKGYQLDNHADFEFTMSTATPQADLVSDLNNETTSPLPERPVMQELRSRISFGPDDYLVMRVIEPNRRWAVLCRFPHAEGYIGGCNDSSRLVRRENNQLRVYTWRSGANAIDFPNLGMDADNLYVATQLNGNPFFTVPKARLRNGTPPALGGVRLVRYGPVSAFSQPLLDLDGNAARRALIVEGSSGDLTFRRIPRLGCNTFECDLAGRVALTSYPSTSAVPGQPGSKRNGAGTHGFFGDPAGPNSNVVLRNGEIHGVQTVCGSTECANYDGTGVMRLRYFRVRVSYQASCDQSGACPAFGFTVLDDLLIPNPANAPRLHTFYGSIAVNDRGQVVAGFSGSSAEHYASSYAAVGQLDTSGQHMAFGPPILLQAGHDEYEVGAESTGPTASGRNRLGDYSATTVDPSDPNRFWTIQEWASALDVWSTQVSEIRLVPAGDAPRITRVSASASGSAHPPTSLMKNNVAPGDLYGELDKGIAVPNGDFMIAPNLQVSPTPPRYPAYTTSAFPLGDGRDEVTQGSLNFAEDLAYLKFSHFQSPRPTAALAYAEFELHLVAGGDCAGDSITLGRLPPIEIVKIFPQIVQVGCAAGDVFKRSVNLLGIRSSQTGQHFTSAEILDAVAATPWSLRFSYRSNATVTLARLSLGVPDLFVLGRGPAIAADFERLPLRHDGKAGAFIGAFAGACRAVDIAYGPDQRFYVLDSISRGFSVCTPGNLVRRFDGRTGEFQEVDDPFANFVPMATFTGADPGGFTFGPDGNLYVTSRGSSGSAGSVLRYQGPFGPSPGASMGEFVAAGAGGLSDPSKLRFGPDGALYVASSHSHSVLRFNGRNGEFIGSFVASGMGGLAAPSDLVFGPNGDLYVAGAGSNNVLRYAGPLSGAPGQFVGQFVQLGYAPGGLAFGPNNDLFVTGAPFTSGFPSGVFRYDGGSGSFRGLFAHVEPGARGQLGPLMFSALPEPKADLGDFNGDHCIDRGDLGVLVAALQRRDTNPAYDLNGDGAVTLADAGKLALLFTRLLGGACAVI